VIRIRLILCAIALLAVAVLVAACSAAAPTAPPAPTVAPTLPPTSAPASPTIVPAGGPAGGPTVEATAAPTAAPTAPPAATRPAPEPTAVPTRPPSPTSTVEPTATPAPVVVTDTNGKPVQFDTPPERMVVYDGAAVEMLFAIGQGHRVVGTHSYVTYPPETASIPKIGDAFNMDIEAIVALEPDLVYVFYDRFNGDLERAGLKVLYIKDLSHGFTEVADLIRMWGLVTGATGEADFEGYQQISPEVVAAANPDIIMGSIEDVTGEPALSGLPAAGPDRIFTLSEGNSFSVAGPQFINAVEEMAAWVYPDRFE
jgi:ABC-type Fe3+-hydroxamate transport system substrate-binding protein